MCYHIHVPPVYMTGLTSSGILAVDKNTPIEVKKKI